MWLLGGAGLLVAVLAGFLIYAHFAAHRFLKSLPGRLGAEISREANGFTYSQSNGKRTLYTIHAARFVQRKNNVITLRDVGIVLYDSTDRASRIYGKEFEYDQAAGVLRADGEVFLDLAAPALADARARAAYAAGSPSQTSSPEPSTPGQQVIHVKTSGVVFAQKLGLASTDQHLEFTYGTLSGSATGAEFHSDTGATLLRSEVRLTAIRSGQPLRLSASRAELDRQAQQVHLDRAAATLPGNGHAASQTATAAQATIFLRTPTSPERIHAEGAVAFTGRGATVHADRGSMVLGASDQPQSGDLDGDVHYLSDTPNRRIESSAGTVHAQFDRNGELEHLVLAGSASAAEQQLAGASAQATVARTVTADQIELVFAASPQPNRRWVSTLTATGTADFLAHQPTGGSSPGRSTDELRADRLVAHLRQAPGQRSGPQASREELAAIDGDGHTAVDRATPDGGDVQSFGDTLHASFLPPGSSSARQTATQTSTQTIDTAEQVGHVRIDQRSPAKSGRAATRSHATADRLTYDAAAAQATLLGSAQLTQEGSVLWANRVVLAQGTGDTQAIGSVKLSYHSSPTAEPVQVIATRADLQHESGLATFFGAPTAPARMWQTGSSVQAPVIELHQREQTLTARAVAASGEDAVVRTVLAPNAPARSGKPVPPVRVLSHELHYAAATRTADFTGGVDVTEGDTEVHGREATIFLAEKPASAASPSGPSGTKISGAPAAPFLGGGALDRIIATGAILVTQPGREATGDRLVYTAADRVSVLTGTPGKPPVVTDAENGTLSGAAIRFLPGDNGQNSVVVSGGGSSEPRVRTETRGKSH